jgi:hypothetical protein
MRFFIIAMARSLLGTLRAAADRRNGWIGSFFSDRLGSHRSRFIGLTFAAWQSRKDQQAFFTLTANYANVSVY